MKQSIVHVALVVRDYDEALEFYTQKLRFTLLEDTYQPEQDKRWVVVAPPGGAAPTSYWPAPRLPSKKRLSAIRRAAGFSCSSGRTTFGVTTGAWSLMGLCSSATCTATCGICSGLRRVRSGIGGGSRPQKCKLGKAIRGARAPCNVAPQDQEFLR